MSHPEDVTLDLDNHVLYGNGTDFNTIHTSCNVTAQYGHAITDMAANKSNVQTVFNNIESDVKDRDFLYVWWMGHGSGYGSDHCDLTMDLSHTGEHVTDVEFAGYLNMINHSRKRPVTVRIAGIIHAIALIVTAFRPPPR